MNNVPITSPKSPVYAQSTVIDYTTAVSQGGQVYSISTGSQSVAVSGFLTVQVTNPANSNKTIYIERISGGSTTNTTIDILKNATITTGVPPTPTTLTINNRNWNSGNNSSMTGKYVTATAGTDPTVGGTLLSSIIQVGGPITLLYNGEFIIPSSTIDREFYIRLVNNGNQVNILSINITWWELPPTTVF